KVVQSVQQRDRQLLELFVLRAAHVSSGYNCRGHDFIPLRRSFLWSSLRELGKALILGLNMAYTGAFTPLKKPPKWAVTATIITAMASKRNLCREGACPGLRPR